MKSRLIGKDPDAGKDGGQEDKGVTDDEMVEIASPTQWTCVWANSGRQWRNPGILQSMGSQRVRHNLATEKQSSTQCQTVGSSYPTLFQVAETQIKNSEQWENLIYLCTPCLSCLFFEMPLLLSIQWFHGWRSLLGYSHGVVKSRTRVSDFTFFLFIVHFGEGNGNPLQCSCLENPMDRGAWWATVYGVAKSQTRLSN